MPIEIARFDFNADPFPLRVEYVRDDMAVIHLDIELPEPFANEEGYRMESVWPTCVPLNACGGMVGSVLRGFIYRHPHGNRMAYYRTNEVIEFVLDIDDILELHGLSNDPAEWSDEDKLVISLALP